MTEEKAEILLAYASAATLKFERKDLDELLAVARKNNERLGLTGMLLYVDGCFFQVLEGSAEPLRELYGRIEADKRHTQVVKLLEQPIEERSFGAWSMGLADVTKQELASIPGLSDFLTSGPKLTEIGPGRAYALLAAFKEGKWRIKLAR